jgi:tetratricopeptide (TPR) repeat protein
MMDLALERVEDNATKSEWGYFVDMRSRQIVDTEDWAQASRWTVSLDQFPSDKGGRGYGTAHFRYQITNALAGLYLGNDSLARVLLEQSRPEEPGQALQIDQLAGLLAIQDGKVEAGLQLLNQAAEAEDALPLAYGPPELVEPAYESLGKSLLAQGHWKEAAAAYRRAIERTPRRPLAVDGFAKAAKQLSADELSSIKVTNKKSAGTARISRKAQEICLPATSG